MEIYGCKETIVITRMVLGCQKTQTLSCSFIHTDNRVCTAPLHVQKLCALTVQEWFWRSDALIPCLTAMQVNIAYCFGTPPLHSSNGSDLQQQRRVFRRLQPSVSATAVTYDSSEFRRVFEASSTQQFLSAEAALFGQLWKLFSDSQFRFT